MMNSKIKNLKGEFWKKIPGFEGCYFVSNFGRFKSEGRLECSIRRVCKRKDRLLKPSFHPSGYSYVTLTTSNAKSRSFSAHRIVAICFLKSIKGKHFVNHINGKKSDNRAVNLEWCNRSENAKHSFKIGLQCNKGEMHPCSKLTNKDVLEIRSMGKLSSTEAKSVSKIYGVSHSTIKDVLSGKTWSHIKNK